MKHFLSILKNAEPGSITYYDGDNPSHVMHLYNCTLICKPELKTGGINKSVKIITNENPQLYFYKISSGYKEDYLPSNKLKWNEKYKSYIHEDANIHISVKINPNCVIGDVHIMKGCEIGSNTTIYNKTTIMKGTKIGSNCTIGTEGMLWCWDGSKKIFLEQLGSVIIGINCIIGSGCNIVRGSANEETIISNNVNMAPGCNIGHGTEIGKNTHLANGINTGGSSFIGPNNFIGVGVNILPGKKITSENVIIGAGSLVTKDISEEGLYIGSPCKKNLNPKYKSTNKLSGVPKWKEN